MASLFNGTNVESIQYVSEKPGQAIVSFSSLTGSGSNTSNNNDDVKMLIDQAAAQFARGVSLKHFLNSGPALMAGKGQGSLTLQGVFGTAEQLKQLCGDPDNLCTLPRNIKLSAGVLKECKLTDATKSSPASSVDLILYNCVVTNFAVTITLQQDGVIFQGANVTMLVTDVGIA